MVRDCIANDRQFGVVLIRSGFEVGGQSDPYLVGTVVRILNADTYDDGAMDLTVWGERRFRIRELDDSRAYLTGYVEPVVEMEIEPESHAAEVIGRVREETETLIRRYYDGHDYNIQVRFPPDPVALSFAVANLLPMENLQKQHLLETTDTVERCEDLLPLLEHQILEYQPGQTRLARIDLSQYQDLIHPN
jgi:Lon protease-like protein